MSIEAVRQMLRGPAAAFSADDGRLIEQYLSLLEDRSNVVV
jgi:hypothetical protein